MRCQIINVRGHLKCFVNTILKIKSYLNEATCLFVFVLKMGINIVKINNRKALPKIILYIFISIFAMNSYGSDCDDLPPGNHSCSIDGRNFEIFVPDVPGVVAMPLVIDMHPMLVPARMYKYLMRWRRVAKDNGFIVAFPSGKNLPYPQWNAGKYCCGLAQILKPDDVGFIRDLVEHISSIKNVNRKKVYATGYSNGGGMSFRLGCEAADIFAAIAPIAQGNPFPDCHPSRPISLINVRGVGDMPVFISSISRFPFSLYAAGPHPEADIADWKEINQCVGEQVDTGRDCKTYNQCAGGVEVTYCRLTPFFPVAGLSHLSLPFVRSIPKLLWEKLSQHELP